MGRNGGKEHHTHTPARIANNNTDVAIPIKIKTNIAKSEDTTKAARKEEIARRAYITKEDYEKRGHTAGCKGCRAAHANLERKSHSEQCKRRMLEELA